MDTPVKLTTQDEAFVFIDTVIRKKWEILAKASPVLAGTELGQAAIVEAVQVEGHQAWHYTIEGLPVSRDDRKRWVLDTGDIFDTTLSEDANTLEKAIAKQGLLK